VEAATILKSDEFKTLLRDLVREQMTQTYQDMDELRRSPGASIIRIEEEIKSIKQRVSSMEQNMATKNELQALEAKMTGRFEGLEGRLEGLEGRFKGLEGRINLITGLMFVMLTLYGALIVKLIFFQ
jgi:hypothetical protein